MRRHLVAALATCVFAAGCSDDDVKFRGDGYSLTVFAYDAVTGAPIDSAALAGGLVLYEGADKVKPVVLDSTRAGAVIFKDVPADYWAGNKVYPIMAEITGYQSFQGEVSYKVALQQDNANKGTTVTPVLQDDLFAQVGYIYLWPVNFHTPDYTFTVTYGGTPVPNAAVQLSVQQASWGTGNNQVEGVIQPTENVLIPAIPSQTDANGKVTFAGSSLLLGAYYSFEVEPLLFQGVQLGSASRSIRVGTSSVDQAVTLSALNLGANTHGLYVTSVTPSPDQLGNNQTLVVTFNIPVAKSSTFATDFSISNALVGPPATIPGFTGGALGSPYVNAQLTSSTTLTLTPNWTTAATSVTNGSTIAYVGGGTPIIVPEYPADGIVLGQLRLADGSYLVDHMTVTVTGP